MLSTDLPRTRDAWSGYIDGTFSFIEQILNSISYGRYKFDLLLTSRQSFRQLFGQTPGDMSQ